MTNEEKKKMYSLLMDGHTYDEVAKEFGYTKQHIQQVFCVAVGRRRGRIPGGIYPNIEEWLTREGLTRAKFADKIGCNSATVTQFLNGTRSGSKRIIDKVLEVTGMTYEEAFKTQSED